MKKKNSFAIVFAGLVGILLVSGCIGSSGAVVQTTTTGEYITIPLSEISENIKINTYNAAGTEIRFITVLGSDGEVRTAFDACEVCGGSKGYAQTGTDVTCRNCGRSFRIDDLGSKNRGGGCWPSHLVHKIKDGQVVIKKSDLEAGKKWFV